MKLKGLKRILRLALIHVQLLKDRINPYISLLRHSYVFPGFVAIRNFLLKYKIFTIVVVIPWLITAFYLVFISVPEYVSTAKIVVEKGQEQNPINITAGLFGVGGNNETYLTQEFITSREMINRLQNYYDFKKHYQSPKIDLISRLKSHPSEKDYQNYFQKMVNTTVDLKTNELVITVRAFSAEIAKILAEQIIEQSKKFVNRVYNTVAEKQYAFSKVQLKLAKDRLFKVSKDVLEWQNENGMFDPAETAKVVGAVTAELKSKLVEKQTELITYSAFMQPESSKVVALKEEIRALKKQIEEQNSDLLSRKEGTNNLNRVLINYQWLQLQLKFAQAEYEAAQQVFDAATINLSKQQNSIIEIEAPNLPDDYEYPKKIYDLVNFLILFLVIFFLIKMTINIIYEHTD
ncbi:hypothetical protein EP47_03610 [Legionella norrlandica]|uniref:Capsule biosynthesis protein n=1 Tax=Legionella norrlandica TaxID=1498499 RepID=A0A0A2SSD4_9GAMM|nr:hypothetical protein [Legionella norrlandica]KGP64020.1 hypothetical protein EP47_03610 [Legionella norrlandica]